MPKLHFKDEDRWITLNSSYDIIKNIDILNGVDKIIAIDTYSKNRLISLLGDKFDIEISSSED